MNRYVNKKNYKVTFLTYATGVVKHKNSQGTQEACKKNISGDPSLALYRAELLLLVCDRVRQVIRICGFRLLSDAVTLDGSGLQSSPPS